MFHIRAFNPNDSSRGFRFTFPEEVTPVIDSRPDEENHRPSSPYGIDMPASWAITMKWKRVSETLPFEKGMFTGLWNRSDDVIVLEDDVSVFGFPNICPTFRTYFEYVRNDKGQIHLFTEVELAEIHWSNVSLGTMIDKQGYHNQKIDDPDPMVEYMKTIRESLGIETTTS